VRLAKLHVYGFRCHKNLPVDISNLTVFIGANDSGKTGILDALDFLLNSRQPAPEDFCSSGGASGAEIVVEGLFSLTEKDEDAGRGKTGETIRIRRTAFREGRPVLEYLTHGFAEEELNRLEALSNDRLEQLVNEKGLQRPAGRYLKEQKIADLGQWAEANAQKIELWTNCPPALAQGLPEYLLFNADVELSAESGPLQTIFRQQARAALESERESADRIAEALAQNLAEQEVALSEIVQQQMPSIARVHAVPRIDLARGLTVELQVEDHRGARTAFHTRGHGVQRMILLAAYRMTGKLLKEQGYDRDVIWGFDEPEIFLHPGAQRLSLAVISDLVDWGLQAVIATHSTVFVDRSTIDSIVLLEQDDAGLSVPRHVVSSDEDAVSAFLEAIKAGIGLRNSDLFYENAFLIVEGATEANSLPTLFGLYTGSSLESLSIRLIDAEGVSNATGLVRFLRDTGKPVVALLDSDAQHPTSTAALSLATLQNRGVQLGQDLFLVGKDSFEDAFSNGILAEALREAFGQQSAQEITGSDLEAARASLGTNEKLSDRLRQLVGVAYKTNFRKPLLGQGLARAIKEEAEIPQVIRDCFERIREYAMLN